jgi:hypothetical protein
VWGPAVLFSEWGFEATCVVRAMPVV